MNFALYYHRDGFDTTSKRLMGRQAAGDSFLRGISRHSSASAFHCCTADQKMFEAYCAQMRPYLHAERPLHWIKPHDFAALEKIGILYRPDPVLSGLAWQRRHGNQNAYSICGITHTIASKETMQSIADLMLNPLHEWDALICTSFAVRQVVDRLFEEWSGYLEERLGMRPTQRLQLPVIPLGIDCDQFAPQAGHAKDRAHWRKVLGIGEQDIAVLYIGRLIFHAKANPAPMYMALEKARRKSGVTIHLIEAGWFEDDKQEAAFNAAASRLCPSVKRHVLDGRRPDVRQQIWSAADIFISLSDNIQETFGLTPVEAMAAGLPVIVSDWDGYKETVRHEVDGFRIPTLLPPSGSTADLAFEYMADLMNYSTFIGHLSMMAAVDIDACAEAICILATHEDLRQRMGRSGMERARKCYDWSVIMQSYEALWLDLTARRQTCFSAPCRKYHPLCPDPTSLYQHYPSQTLHGDMKFTINPSRTLEPAQRLDGLWMYDFGGNKRLAEKRIMQILDALERDTEMTVTDIMSRFSENMPELTVLISRTLVYLNKFGIIREVS